MTALLHHHNVGVISYDIYSLGDHKLKIIWLIILTSCILTTQIINLYYFQPIHFRENEGGIKSLNMNKSQCTYSIRIVTQNQRQKIKTYPHLNLSSLSAYFWFLKQALQLKLSFGSCAICSSRLFFFLAAWRLRYSPPIPRVATAATPLSTFSASLACLDRFTCCSVTPVGRSSPIYSASPHGPSSSKIIDKHVAKSN